MSVTSLGPKPNVILFDQQLPSIRPSTSQGDLGRIPDAISMLGDLNKRILKIQIYEQVLRDKTHSLQSKGMAASASNIVPSSNNFQDILNVLERKLHILVMQSNKVLEDLKDQIQRVLTKEIMDRKVNDYELKAQSDRLQKLYLDKIKQMESTHSGEVLKLERKNQTIEKAFEQRMQRIQNKLMDRIKELERREEGYKMEIQRMKAQSIDSKRFEQLELQLQQTKVALKNLPQKSQRDGLTTRMDGIDKDTTHSRMRRNKIFEKKQEEMPAAMVSPIHNQYFQVASINILTKQLEDLTSQLNLHFNHNSEGSDEDVFFYPEASKAQMELQASTKIASPFDVNNKY